jgi:alkaline phosphatase
VTYRVTTGLRMKTVGYSVILGMLMIFPLINWPVRASHILLGSIRHGQIVCWLATLIVCGLASPLNGQTDIVRELQANALTTKQADWGFWGANLSTYFGYQSHSNRLIPVYTFGIDMECVRGVNSPYRNEDRLMALYGQIPQGTLNPNAEYFDQTDIYQLQLKAIEAGKKYVFLVVFDGMDWQTSRAAAIYKSQQIGFTEGRGAGLHFLDYRGVPTYFGAMVTSAYCEGDELADVNAQRVSQAPLGVRGGYSDELGGPMPWSTPPVFDYLIGKSRALKHVVTDSASSATSMTSGYKTFNAAINFDMKGRQHEPIARWLQREKEMAIGVVTSVPISHATPAAAYSNNISRDDYQDLTRDLLGLPSISHPNEPLSGVDVLIGAGWGDAREKEEDNVQGVNFVPGNRYLTDQDLQKSDIANDGRYWIAQRTADQFGEAVLFKAALSAAKSNGRLLGFFGTAKAHLPFRTADGGYDPVGGDKEAEAYQPADLKENPTLSQMTSAALTVLQEKPNGFWLMVEAGDVDWANHDNNIDNSIGAVLSGDEAVKVITDWVEAKGVWNETALIVTADHGHYFHLTRPEVLIEARTKIGSSKPTQ